MFRSRPTSLRHPEWRIYTQSASTRLLAQGKRHKCTKNRLITKQFFIFIAKNIPFLPKNVPIMTKRRIQFDQTKYIILSMAVQVRTNRSTTFYQPKHPIMPLKMYGITNR